MVPQVDLRGFFFEKINVDWPKDCGGKDNFDLKILIILSKRNGYNNGFDDYILKCNGSFSNIFQIQLAQINKKKDPLAEILKSLPQETNKTKIEEIYNSEGLKNYRLFLADFFIKVINEEKDKIGRRILILETIKNQPDELLKYLLELSVALDSDNQAWSKKMVKKVIEMGPEEILSPRAIESSDLHSKLVLATKTFLIKFKKVFRDEMLKKMFINQLVNLMPTEELKDELPFWSADWTLADMRGFLDSATYGKPFIGFWYLELLSSTYEAEVLRYIKEVIDEEGLKKYGKSYSWLLASYQSKRFDAQMIPIFKELWDSGSSYKRFLVLNLMEGPHFKELMVKDIPELSKPLFQLKRVLLFDMLKRGENLNFSIYQLLKLGDRSDELLWWASLYEK